MESIFLVLYTIFFALIFTILLPILPILSISKTKYRESIPARFFLWKNSPLDRDGIWFHVCSYGEAKSISPLVNSLPHELLRMSAITQTGRSAIRKYTKQSRYLVFEPLLFWWARPQKVLVVMEAELWYLLFAISAKKGAKTLLINARISDNSFSRYRRWGWLYRQIFKYVDETYAQTHKDKDRLELLGAKNVRVMGSLKFASLPNISTRYDKPDGIMVCAGSTHPKEETLILQAFKSLKQKQPDAKIIVAPRHPERFKTVERMMRAYADNQNWSFSMLSQNERFDTDLLLVDRLGELVNCYAISDLVVLGGAFEPIGGHNAAEAAQFGCKIISGEHYFNQTELFAGIDGIVIVKKEELPEVLQYPALLPECSIVTKTNIAPIVESIESVL